jgi:hypothetical protein
MVASVVEFPAPDAGCREDDASYLYSRLRSQFFEVVMKKWSLADRHQLRCALENVPHWLMGDLLVRRDASRENGWYAPEDAYALEAAFRSFALRRGLLSENFFQQPGHDILPVYVPSNGPQPVPISNKPRPGLARRLLRALHS